MNSNFLNDILQFVELGSVTVKKALDEVARYRAMEKSAADLKAPLVDYMVEHGIVPAEQKDAALSMLSSHAESLQLLKASVDKIIELRRELNIKKANYLGRADNAMTYPDPNMSLTDNYIGRRVVGPKASDLQMLKILDNPYTLRQ